MVLREAANAVVGQELRRIDSRSSMRRICSRFTIVSTYMSFAVLLDVMTARLGRVGAILHKPHRSWCGTREASRSPEIQLLYCIKRNDADQRTDAELLELPSG